jgi:hypothetical protein
MCPFRLGLIHTSVHAGGITWALMRRSVAASRTIEPSAARWLNPRPERLRRMPGWSSLT